MPLRRLAAAAAAVLATLLLAGCVPISVASADAPIFARLNEGAIEILVCESFEAPTMVVTAVRNGTIEVEEIWRVEIPDVSAGDVVVLGTVEEGWVDATPYRQFDLSDFSVGVGIGPISGDYRTLQPDGVVFGGFFYRELGAEWSPPTRSNLQPCEAKSG